jgi:hypothetical protein
MRMHVRRILDEIVQFWTQNGVAMLGLFQERAERGDTERHLQTKEVVQNARRS